MAAFTKFAASAVRNQIKHIERTLVKLPEHIDGNKVRTDYFLSPDKGMSTYDYYTHRISELYCLKREDVKPLAGCIITAPQELAPENYQLFFQSSYEYLCNLFGEENCISCVVHMDEEQPHLHYLFIPVAKSSKHPGGKVSAKEVLTRKLLRDFHQSWQNYLNKIFERLGIKAPRVYTGVTARKGGNKTINQLKQEHHTFEHQHQVERGFF